MRARYGEITKDVLLMLVATGFFVVAVTSPYFLINIARGIAKQKKYSKKNSSFKEAALVRSLSGLNKNKIIIIKNENGNFTVRLTEKGKKVVKKIQFDNMAIEVQKVWDGRWRIVIFDIPERRGKYTRDAMRRKLQKIGFYQLQKSVWVYPYHCEKEVQLLCEVFGINPFVNIITVQSI